MIRNFAGQSFFFEALDTDGAAVTTGVTGTVAKDTAADAAIAGALTHIGSGKWRCDPSQDDTDGSYLGFGFTGGTMFPITMFFDTTITSIIAEGKTEETVEVSSSLTIGTETGTSENTKVQDGTEWVLTSVAGGISAGEIFNIGTAGQNPSALRIWGHWDSGPNRVLMLQAYNFTQGIYEDLTPTLTNDSSNFEILRSLGRAYVRTGTGPGVDGDVNIRFLYDTTVSNNVNAGDDLHLDKVSIFFNSETITIGEILNILLEGNPNRNYPDSAIVLDAENGQPGTKFGENGTPGNPVSNITDMFNLANQSGFRRVLIRGNSTITLDQTYGDWEFILSPGATLDFNGQNVEDSAFIGGALTGTAIGTTVGIGVAQARLEGVTAFGFFDNCTLAQVNSVTANGPSLFLINCESSLPGPTNPSVSGGGVAGLEMSITKYGGGVDVGGLADDANVTISGAGSFELTDAATTATIIVSGNIRQVGSVPTGAAYLDTARVTQATPMTVTNADVATSTRASQSSVDALNDVSVSEIWDETDGVETGISQRQALRLQAANAAGDLSGGGTAQNVILAADKSKPRITAAVDPQGNRTNTLDTS